MLDPTIPEDPGRVRAMLELSGWSLRPTFDGQGNTVSVNVTYVIQVDIRGNLPSSVVKSMTTSMTSAVSRLNQFINKSGYPPYASHISGTRLLDAFDPTSGFFELCYKATPGWTEVRIGRKVYKDGYDFFVKPDDPTVKVEMAPDFGGVRIWTTLDHEGVSIMAQVSKKGQDPITSETVEDKNETETEVETEASEQLTRAVTTRSRSASNSTVNTQETSSKRPESQVSTASKSSQTTDRSRSTRGRASRAFMAIPAGTPPPPLPRRSSSLTRYSIPIAPFLSGADAPPMPANTSAAIASATEATSRPVSSVGSLASPTLGFFHTPSTPLTPTPHDIRSIHPMDSITTILSDKDSTEIVSLSLGDESVRSSFLSLSSQASPASTPMPSPMATSSFHPMSSLRNNASSTSLSKKRDVRVTFSLDTIVHSPAEDEGLLKPFIPLGNLVRSNSITSVNSLRSDDAPTLAKEHAVRIVTAQNHHHQGLVAEEMQSSDSESDTEFVEARDELSDDEMEFAVVLTGVSAWPSAFVQLQQQQEEDDDLFVEGASIYLADQGLKMLRAGIHVEVKVVIVFLLLVYYAGRLASLIA